jgi:hypothetical protein
LSPYRREAALAVTDRPNFSPEDFSGFYRHPDGVPAFDTVYINSSGQQQERLAPLIVGLINQIKEARYARHRKIQSLARGAWFPPLVLALDETANIAPLPDLPSVVSQGGSQGVTVVAVFQNLHQAKARWRDEGVGFLTNFQDRLVFPGIWDKETLEDLSALIGEYDRPVTSTSEDPSEMAKSRFRYTHSIQREPILPPSDIRGGYPGEPGAALYLRGRNHYWVHTTPYYSTVPWPQILIAAMERWAGAPKTYPQRHLPVPELDRLNPDTWEPWLCHPQLDPSGGLLNRYTRARELLRR